MSQLWSLIIRVVEESSGNDPQSVSHRSQCLAGMSRRLQGLLSIVLIIGLEPITSDVSGRRSHQLSYMSGCGLGRGRTYDLRVNSSLLYHWATSPFVVGADGIEPPRRCFTDTIRTLPIPPFCTLYRDRTCDLLYVRQPLLPSELRVFVLVLLSKYNHFLV